MVKYLKDHEILIRQLLDSKDNVCSWEEIRAYHNSKIGYLQHERLIHLLVTLAFALFLLISISVSVITVNIGFIMLDALLLLLLFPYIIHYYKLENGVQRLYYLSEEIERRCGNRLK